jgi:hypothetical protein
VVRVLLATGYAFDDRRRLSEVYQRIGCTGRMVWVISERGNVCRKQYTQGIAGECGLIEWEPVWCGVVQQRW